MPKGESVGFCIFSKWRKKVKEHMKIKDIDLSRTEWEYLIEEYVLSIRDRRIMKSRIIDGMTYEDIAELYDMSVTQICTIVRTCKERMLKHLQEVHA